MKVQDSRTILKDNDSHRRTRGRSLCALRWHGARFVSKMLRSILFASLLCSAVSLDLKINKIKCESRPVSISFDYICDGDFLCTFGEPESMEGYFKYYGLVDQFSATSNDYLILDANFIYTLTSYTHTVNLVNKLQMPLCHSSLQANKYNTDGDCPADGKFHFDTVYDMPELSSSLYVGWAASGWSGQVVVDFYLNNTNTDLVGKCKMDVTTMVTGSYENGAFRTVPSAKTVTYSVLGSLLGALALCLACGSLVRKRRNRKVPLLDTPPQAANEITHMTIVTDTIGEPGEPTSDYQRVLKLEKDHTFLL